MTKPEIVFAEPPPDGRKANGGSPGFSPVGLWLRALRDHPGEWAVYPEPVSAATLSVIRSGKRYGVKAREFEVTGRKVDGTHPLRVTMYARYVGGES